MYIYEVNFCFFQTIAVSDDKPEEADSSSKTVSLFLKLLFKRFEIYHILAELTYIPYVSSFRESLRFSGWS